MRVVVESRQNRCFIAHFNIQRVGEQDGVRFARIHAAPEDAVVQQAVCGNVQPLDDGAADVALGVVERQFDFG